jgi:hypothetical protein
MVCISLEDLILEEGYPRHLFTKELNRDDNFGVIYDEFYHLDVSDGYYHVTDIKGNVSLVRYTDKKGEFDTFTSHVPKRIYSAIIKDIILKPFDDDHKYNMVLYVLYYVTIHRAYDELSSETLTNGVILHLSNIIKLMIDREYTTYKAHPVIEEAIEYVRRLLTRERIHLGIKPRLNLRR